MEVPVALSVFVCLALVCLSALFSGLTLGLLSLDTVGLQILADVGDPVEQEYAKAILPIRRNGNLLLCTLLVGNTTTNAFLSIFLADLTSGAVGLFASTALIVILGEITPQSICTRHGLYVGAKTIVLTRFFMAVFFPVTWPVAKALDWALGQEVGTMYNKQELKRLIELHTEHPAAMLESGLTRDERNLLTGALEYAHKKVADVMTTIDNVYMVEASTKLDFDTMLDIYKCGYTRIPVYEGHRQNIVGILYVKDLILVDPDDEMEVRTIISFNGRTHLRFVIDTTPLNEAMSLFQKSHIHLMIAVKLMTTFDEMNGLTVASPTSFGGKRLDDLPQATRQVTGIITLEDVLEEVIKAEIVDEHDNYISNNKGARVKSARGDVSKYLSLFSHKIREQTRLTPQEIQAIAAYVASAIPEFKHFKGSEALIKGLVRNGRVVEVD